MAYSKKKEKTGILSAFRIFVAVVVLSVVAYAISAKNGGKVATAATIIIAKEAENFQEKNILKRCMV